MAKFKQQHQGNRYFVPTPVMEPAFVIQHFAGKVKYQVKVRGRKPTGSRQPLTVPSPINCHQDIPEILDLVVLTPPGFPREEHRPHASGHRGPVAEQRPRVRAPAYWHGPGGHVSVGHPEGHDKRHRCLQRGRPVLGRQNVRCVCVCFPWIGGAGGIYTSALNAKLLNSLISCMVYYRFK